MSTKYPPRVGEVRPSQLLYTYGVGAIIDLPKLSVIITGLEDWQVNPEYFETIVEDRLLTAVRFEHPDVKKLLAPPIVPDSGMPVDPFESTARVGVPVANFPRWMVCPSCRLLAPLSSGLFELKVNPYYPDRTAYIHKTCNKGKNPQVVPARFLTACEQGHLDDFPWNEFVHRGNLCDGSLLRLIEYGASGEARDLEVKCDTCGERRRLSEAFGEENRKHMPRCRGRRPHLRDYDPEGCPNQMRTLILGASNTWFPVVYSTVAIPSENARLPILINEQWATFLSVTSPTILEFLRSQGQLGELSEFSNEEIWEAIETRRRRDAGELPPPSELPDLIEPEWEIFTNYDPALNSDEFRLTPVDPPRRYAEYFDQVVLVERMREVRALVGFTRLDAVGELTDPDLAIPIDPAPISRQPPTWVPANEVRGEGIFLQFNERQIEKWLRKEAVADRTADFLESHTRWRQMRHIEPPEEGFPGMRYILIHTFAHALMRQLALESGYSSASIRERIYARPPKRHSDPMAGLLIYTSAPDSEGTLGGLVNLGRTENLERHIAAALEASHLCASDPLCAEHLPSQTGRTLHAAACHACLFASETSCERGNKYLDRSLLVQTVEREDLAFFE
ncbi:MAG: DrmB family protein [Candidatus Promineifilaceae bacterium]